MARVKSGKGQPLTPEQEAAIVQEFVKGGFINDICRRLHHAPRSVYKVLDDAGLRGGVPIDEAGL